MSEAVEASLCYFFENWLMKLKFPNLRNIQIPSNKIYLAYFYLSEPFQNMHFAMRDPVDSRSLGNQVTFMAIRFICFESFIMISFYIFALNDLSKTMSFCYDTVEVH